MVRKTLQMLTDNFIADAIVDGAGSAIASGAGHLAGRTAFGGIMRTHGKLLPHHTEHLKPRFPDSKGGFTDPYVSVRKGLRRIAAPTRDTVGLVTGAAVKHGINELWKHVKPRKPPDPIERDDD